MKRYGLLILLSITLLLSSSSGLYGVSAAQIITTRPETCSLDQTDIKVYRVYYRQLEDISLLQQFDLFEFNNKLEQYVLVAASPAELAQIQLLGFTTALDLQETANFKKIDLLKQYSLDTIPGYGCYRTVEEIFDWAAANAAAYPDLVEWIDVGDSWEKSVGQPDGYDMMVLRLTNEMITGDKPKLLITAAIHAREYTTAELAARFGEYLIQGYNTNADVHWLLDYHEIHIMLQANPDGRKEAEAGILWRKNTNENYCGGGSSRGADLNRNFDFEWGAWGGSSGNQCSETYRGPNPASEPETQAIQAYMNLIFPDQRDESSLSNPAPLDATGIYIDIHSYSRLVLWSWGFMNTDAPNHTQLQTLGRRFAYFNNHTPQKSYQLYTTDGTTDDYAYGRLGVAGYCFELGDEFFEDCSVFEFDILPNNLPALIYAAKTVRTPYITPAGPEAINLAVSESPVPIGTPVTLTAQINDTRFRSGYSDPTQPIAEAEYAIDIPYWEAGYTPVPMSASDGSFNSTIENVTVEIDTSGLSEGRHIVYVRGKDSADNWGPVSAVFLTVVDMVNHPPTADDLDVTTLVNQPVNFTLTGSDPDDDPIWFTVVSDPVHGTLSLATPEMTYTPAPDYAGTDSFTFITSDGELESPVATVTIEVLRAYYIPIIMK